MTQARLLALALSATAVAQDILLPPAPGPYDVTIRTTELNDFSREEIFSPDGGNRRLMVSIYSPIPKGSEDCVSPYMPKTVANYLSALYAAAPPPLNLDFDFQRFVQPFCSHDVTYGPVESSNQGSGQNASSSFPLIIFGHGYTGVRFYYNIMLQHFASYGYIVANIDHPYDARIIEYPDGSTVFSSENTTGTQENMEKNLASRRADVSFVLDQISQNCTLRSLVLAPQARVSSFEEVGIWGHSFGGATAFQALLDDPRFQGAIDIDGELSGSVVGTGVDRPVLFWADGDGLAHPKVTETWPNFTDYRQMLVMEGSQHDAMMDAKLLADLAGLEVPIFGTIDGAVQTKTIVNYAVDFFKFVLQGEEGLGLLKGPSEEYPHVTFTEPKQA